MRDYEVMLIIRPDLDEEKTEATITKFTGLLETQGATEVKLDKWGKRRLAYEIDDQREGFYAVINFKSGSPAVHELERVLKITDEVLRHLVVRQET
jgi:small subunit ribosomal protein S6